jgi:hypothetical protein
MYLRAKCAAKSPNTRPADASPKAFGLKVAGSCLAPRVNDGETLIVDQGFPAPGDLAVFWFKGHEMPLVKILMTNLRGLWPLHPKSDVVPLCEVGQSNPRKRFRFSLDKIERISRVSHIVPNTQS